MTRSQPNPTSTWRVAVAKARENTAVHWSSREMEQILWQQGFGPVASARILDWYCSCHPEVIAQQAAEKARALSAQWEAEDAQMTPEEIAEETAVWSEFVEGFGTRANRVNFPVDFSVEEKKQ